MAWSNDEAARKHSNATYGSEWKRVRVSALQRDRWRCQARLPGCQGAASQVDHIVPVSQGGTHALANLRAICRSCHGKVTAIQGGEGFRQSGSLRKTTDPPHSPRTAW